MGMSTEPIEHIDWFERDGNPPCVFHQPINSDALEGAIRNPIQLEEVVERALRGSVCSLPLCSPVTTRGTLEFTLNFQQNELLPDGMEPTHAAKI